MNRTPVNVPAGPAPLTASQAAAVSGRRLRLAAIVALVLIVVAAIAGFLPRWRQRAQLQSDTREMAVQTVAVVSPQAGKSAGGLSVPAEIKPYLDAPIYARSSGYLTNWLVDIGGQVKEGDLLAEIDAPELRQELVRSKAELAQAEAALALAKITADRWAELLKTSSVSEQEAAEKKADFELKSANVEAARATVRRLEQLQSFSRVRAPFSGTITARGVDIGQLIVGGGGRELFHLTQTSKLRVFVHVPESAAQGIHIGQVAELSIPGMPGKTFEAKVVRTAGAISVDSRTLLTELQVDNAKNEILAGTFAQVRFPEVENASVLTIPSNALLFRSEGPQVGVVRSDNKVELRAVALGRDFGANVEIISGVSKDDQIILNPPDSLVAGTEVRVAHGSSDSK